MTSLSDKRRNGKNSPAHYRIAAGFSYAGAPFHLFSVQRGHGGIAQIVPSSFMDTHYSDAIRCVVDDIVLRITA
jgi:hypothetical protein